MLYIESSHSIISTVTILVVFQIRIFFNLQTIQDLIFVLGLSQNLDEFLIEIDYQSFSRRVQ